MSTATVTMSLDEYNDMKNKCDQLDKGLLELLSRSKYYSYDWYRPYAVLIDDDLIKELTDKLKENNDLLNKWRKQVRGC